MNISKHSSFYRGYMHTQKKHEFQEHQILRLGGNGCVTERRVCFGKSSGRNYKQVFFLIVTGSHCYDISGKKVSSNFLNYLPLLFVYFSLLSPICSSCTENYAWTIIDHLDWSIIHLSCVYYVRWLNPQQPCKICILVSRLSRLTSDMLLNGLYFLCFAFNCTTALSSVQEREMEGEGPKCKRR